MTVRSKKDGAEPTSSLCALVGPAVPDGSQRGSAREAYIHACNGRFSDRHTATAVPVPEHVSDRSIVHALYLARPTFAIPGMTGYDPVFSATARAGMVVRNRRPVLAAVTPCVHLPG